jgi:hypothetical protein
MAWYALEDVSIVKRITGTSLRHNKSKSQARLELGQNHTEREKNHVLCYCPSQPGESDRRCIAICPVPIDNMVHQDLWRDRLARTIRLERQQQHHLHMYRKTMGERGQPSSLQQFNIIEIKCVCTPCQQQRPPRPCSTPVCGQPPFRVA